MAKRNASGSRPQIGSGLVGVLYVLDEPSIGLHQRDNQRLIDTMVRLRDLGNTVIVVEHDEETIRVADMVVDIGPGAGEHGGEIVAAGSLASVIRNKRSVTGQYLSGKRTIVIPEMRRQPRDAWIGVRGARENNLQDLDVEFPLGCFVAVTGVSGSGKSTLVNDILLPGVDAEGVPVEDRAGTSPQDRGRGAHRQGHQHRSVADRAHAAINPATYTGVFDKIRALFAATPEAKVRGYQQGRFRFNVKGGRCEACEGDGTIKIEMHFLPDVYVPCEVCKGSAVQPGHPRRHVQGQEHRGRARPVDRGGAGVLRNQPTIARQMQTLFDVGLGYVRLGQPAPTLSGGEAQRVKLAAELGKRATGRTIYILDEPTTGLHFDDVRKLLGVLQRLVDTGQHGARDRAQSRRDQVGRLDHRPRARGRRRRRPRHRRGHARASWRRRPRVTRVGSSPRSSGVNRAPTHAPALARDRRLGDPRLVVAGALHRRRRSRIRGTDHPAAEAAPR